MTENQIKIDALLTVAGQQVEELANSVSLLRALNRGGDGSSFCEISHRAGFHLQAACNALAAAHQMCGRSVMERSAQGGLVH